MTEMDSEVRRKRIEIGVKWGVTLLGVCILSPILFVVGTALAGAAVGFGIAGVVGLAIINFAPVLSMKFANWKMKAIVGEAAENPIETMQNLRIEKEQELREADEGIVQYEAEVSNYADETKAFAKKYPEEAPQFQETLEQMRAGLVQTKEARDEQASDLEDLVGRIEKAQALYNMALATERVTQFSKSAEQKVFQQIKEKVAFDAVRNKMNQSSARLNMALRQRQKGVAALPPAQPRMNVIDAPIVEVVRKGGGR